MDSEIACIHVGEIKEGRERCRFLAMGDAEKEVKILSLESANCFYKFHFLILPTDVSSVHLIEMKNDYSQQNAPQLYLYVGLCNGMLLKTSVDDVSGTLSDTRTRFLGNKKIELFKTTINDNPALIALSSRMWLCYNYMEKYLTTPVAFEPFEFTSSFSSEQYKEAVVGINSNKLSIIAP